MVALQHNVVGLLICVNLKSQIDHKSPARLGNEIPRFRLSSQQRKRKGRLHTRKGQHDG